MYRTATLRTAFRIAAVVAAAAAIQVIPKRAAGQDPPPAVDIVCQQLMDDYILRGIKVSSDTVDAASELIAVRGRDNGYWQVVFDYYRRDRNEGEVYSPEGKLLRILTKMLKRDGNARWSRTHPDPTRASGGDVVLSPDVLDTVIARARQKRGRALIDHVVAAVVAHDPRSEDFLREIMSSGPPPYMENDLFGTPKETVPPPPVGAGNTNARFLAAVGLAELGDEAGIEWLVADPVNLAPYNFFNHVDGRNNPLGTLMLSLADLTGENFRTIEEWRAWWAAKKRDQPGNVFQPVGRVRLQYP